MRIKRRFVEKKRGKIKLTLIIILLSLATGIILILMLLPKATLKEKMSDKHTIKTGQFIIDNSKPNHLSLPN